ncbi:hypothetical protein COHA_000347 [Chlorella ohadii]|uniref:Uncharacterized protein n=1 Tax=Chlorella ohadii TaxID=2649997 RepID=A0AAD5DYX6_9CHLO|nr:hypothetical protein COHA_000347 [Chlorella ohadii]
MLMSGNQGCQLAGSAAAKIATPEPASFGRAAQLAHGRAERAVAIGAPEGDSICTVPLSPRQRECLARGQAFKANLPSAEPQQGPNPFDAPFVSPITTARDPVFFEYAARTPTDKVGAHAYHYLYNRYLPHARLHDLNILEIGLGCNMEYGAGASLKIWRALLPCANISFIDYDAACAEKYKTQIESEGGGRLYIGSQDDPKLLAQIVADAQAAGGFDMIVDDGSHRVNHIFASLSALWPVLKPGGVYIMEDLDEHWFVPETWAMYETGPPATLPIPLFQRLIHSINCLTKDTFAYSKDYKAWCRKEQANSIFKDVINVDCMPEACALVKGRPLAGI